MFNVGGMELVVIALVALIVLGPQRLPGAIRQVGQVMGELRRLSSGFQTDLRSAIDQAEREAAAEQAKSDAAASSGAETVAGPDAVTPVEPARPLDAVDHPDGSVAASGPPLADTTPPGAPTEFDEPAAPLFGLDDETGRAAS